MKLKYMQILATVVLTAPAIIIMIIELGIIPVLLFFLGILAAIAWIFSIVFLAITSGK